MARLTEEQREQIVDRWRCGESQNSIAKRFPISVATVNKLCKGVPQDNVDLVNAQVFINQELSSKVNNEVNTINQVVDERTRHLIFFQNSALKGQKLANDALDYIVDRYNNADDDEKEELTGKAMYVAKEHSTVTNKNKETVLGKQPDTAIQINNNNEAPKTLDDFYNDV